MANIITLTEEELEDVIEKVIKSYRKKERQKEKADKYHDTFSLMKVYRDVAIHIEESVSEAEQLELDEMTEEQSTVYLQSIRDTKIRSMLMELHIDRMLQVIKERKANDGKPEEYEAFERYFINGEGYEEISKELNSSPSTTRRWVSGILRELSPLLWGYDSVMKKT